MKITYCLLITLFITIVAFGQQPNQWKGFTLDKTSVSQVLEKLGTPKSDKGIKIQNLAVGDLLTKDLKQNKWRVLQYETVENAKGVQFVFDQSGKLSIMQFQLKDLSPTAFINAYKIQFKPHFSGMTLASNPQDFQRDGQGNIYAKNYPTIYRLIGESETSYVIGIIENSSFASEVGKAIGIPSSTLAYPGKVLAVQLVSAKLKNNDGINGLK